MGWFGDLIKGVPLLGPLIGAGVDALTTSSANKTNRKIAREQMRFQERMSSTEMQRRVKDLQAAGLNPMLAGLNQQGASSAQGASTRVEPITRNSASTALAMATQRAQLENMDMQTRLLRDQGANVRSDTFLKEQTAVQTAGNIQILEAQLQKLAVEFKTAQAQYDITEEQLKEKRLTNAQLEALQPLLVQAQMLENRAKQLGMTQREIDQKFAEDIGKESKWLRFIRDLAGASNPRSN